MTYSDPSEVCTCAGCGDSYPRCMLGPLRDPVTWKPLVPEQLYCVDCIDSAQAQVPRPVRPWQPQLLPKRVNHKL
jgi:hypothetical protein